MFSYLIGRQDCFGFAFSSSNRDVPQQRYLNDVFIDVFKPTAEELLFCRLRKDFSDYFLGLWNASNEPPQGLSRQTFCSEFSHLRRRVRDRLLQKTGNS